jgi:hypothetical protein
MHRARAASGVRRTNSRNPPRFLHGDQYAPYAIDLSPCLELGRAYSAPDEKIDGYGIYKSREEASEQEGSPRRSHAMLPLDIFRFRV